MLEMQRILQEKYKEKWERISLEVAQNKLLWMISKIEEVIDIIKKNGSIKVNGDKALQKRFVEELADVL